MPLVETPKSESSIRLEEKVAFLERHVEELDAVVRELYEKIAAVQKELTRLRDDVGQRFEDIDRGPEDDVPPHWGG